MHEMVSNAMPLVFLPAIPESMIILTLQNSKLFYILSYISLQNKIKILICKMKSKNLGLSGFTSLASGSFSDTLNVF
jgi:hypothetical protein